MVLLSVAKSAELGYFNTLSAGCFSCLQVEASCCVSRV